jgi:hypothetical protein
VPDQLLRAQPTGPARCHKPVDLACLAAAQQQRG